MSDTFTFDSKGVAVGEEARVNISKVDELTGGVLFKVTGQLTTYNSTYFQALANEAIAQGYKNIIVDCGALNYCSSTGVGAFTFIIKALKDVNGNIVLANMQPKVMDVFQLLGFSQFFNFVASPDEAVKLFSNRKPAVKPAPVAKTESLEVTFPITATCPSCPKKFRVSKSGRYRCSGCQKVFAVAPNGKVYS